MLKFINTLAPFFEDCYRRINIREYSRLMKISPPNASKVLLQYHKTGILQKEKERNYIFYCANKKSKDFVDLSRIYWRIQFKKLIETLEKELINPTIILFGSLSKAETKTDSDIDLCILATKKKINISTFEKELKRKIQFFFFKSIKEIKSKELQYNILNSYILHGRIKNGLE